jgi:putative membrane protein
MLDGWEHMMGWGGAMFDGIGTLLLWGVIIVLLVLLAWGFIGRSRSQSLPRSTPLDILKERYAKGEISRDEYEQCKKTLAG